MADDYRVTPEEAVQWALEYPYPHSGIRIKPFPKVTEFPTYGAPAAVFLPVINAPLEPPINLSPPFIYGRGEVGVLLRVVTGTWDNYPLFHYQWRKDGVDIDGALDAVYTIRNADIFSFIDAVVTGFNTAGTVSVASSNQIEVLVGPLILPDGDTWILITRFWDDTGIWIDDAVVVLPENTWILFTGNWDDEGLWDDLAIVVL